MKARGVHGRAGGGLLTRRHQPAEDRACPRQHVAHGRTTHMPSGDRNSIRVVYLKYLIEGAVEVCVERVEFALARRREFPDRSCDATAQKYSSKVCSMHKHKSVKY